MTGAGGGIGSNICTYLSSSHTIYAIVRSRESFNKFNNISSSLIPLKVDVTKKEEIKSLFKNIKSLDVLINCAAILRPVGNFLENNLDEWEKNIKTNLLGTVYMCYYAIPLLKKSTKGTIINFAGGGSAYGRPYHTAYASSKTAVVRFSESLAMEYPNIDINSIAPGAHKTGMWKDESIDREPQQWGEMTKLIEFINFLISPESKGITGKFIHYKDDWKRFSKRNLNSDKYTLRRII